MEFEGKHYFKKNFLALCSVSHQTVRVAGGDRPPVPDFGAKAGISYQTENGITASLFDVYQGQLDGFSATLNPSPHPFHLLNAHFRWDLTRRLKLGEGVGLALYAHGENLANEQVWLPAWGDYSVDTVPVNHGRTVYFGLELSFKKKD